MLGVWLYAYALGITSARQLERRLVEDLPLRHLAGGARVDNWSLSAFRRRNLEQMEEQSLDGYVPDSNLAQTLNLGTPCRSRACAPAHLRNPNKKNTHQLENKTSSPKTVIITASSVLTQTLEPSNAPSA
jgi:hypothetical protein